jgi:hypothetical protein
LPARGVEGRLPNRRAAAHNQRMQARLFIALLGCAVPAHAAWYRVQVPKVDVAPLHHGQAWDHPPPDPKDPPKSCCLHGDRPDGVAPDVEVLVSMGKRQFATRMRQDDFHPKFRDFGFLERQSSEPVVVEVWDRDGDGRELIGETRLLPDQRGQFSVEPLRFGEVERMEISLEKVDAPVETIRLAQSEGQFDTHLFLPAHHSVKMTATGKLCWGRSCATPDEAAREPNRSGHLVAFDGSDDAEQVHDYHPGLELVPDTSGPLKLYIKPGDGVAAGSYLVVVSFQ